MLSACQRLPNFILWPILAAGAGALLLALKDLPAAQPGLGFLLFALVTLSLGTRFVVKVPRSRDYVSVADAFTLLALFTFGAGAATPLAAVAAACASLRLTRDARAVLSCSATAALWVLLSDYALGTLFGPATQLSKGGGLGSLALALCLVAALRSALAFVFAAAAPAGEHDERRGLAQLSGFLFWAFVTNLAVASAAGLLAAAVEVFGLLAFLAAATLVACAHFVYGVYLRNVEASAARHGRLAAPKLFTQDAGEVFRSAFEYAAIGMGLVTPKGRWLKVNRSLCELLGYPEDELMGKGLEEVVHADDKGHVLAHLKDLLKGSASTYRSERRFVHRQGHAVWLLWSAAPIADDDSGDVRLIFQAQDITDRKLSEEQLLHNAFHDALTGLPNRALFIDHVKLTISRARRREGHVFAVLFLDLDRFKVINDSLGHAVGDQLLVGIARRLETCLREGDTVARVGGDEFTVLLEDIEDESEAAAVAERIQKELSAPFNLDGHEVFTTASIGVATSSVRYDDPEDLLRDADTAMYRAKSLGKARYEIFDEAMHAVAVNLLQLETDLRKALERRELFLVYQPIVALDDFHLYGFEALVRWQHPERGLISPMDFIPVAEDTGQILAIGEWALMEACKQMRRWQKLFPSDVPLFISVNLSGKQFAQPDLIEQIRSTLERTKLSPRGLKLEITESVVMENIETATDMLRQLRELGVQLAIDDFGTGYSSLSYLHRFPIDTLKIDRSFVTRMSENNENTEIVRTIVVLAQNLGMDVVAEGVETKEQLALLRKLGCENGQGYYFSRPSSAADAEKVIADTRAQPQPSSPREASAPPLLTDDKVKSFRVLSPM